MLSSIDLSPVKVFVSALEQRDFDALEGAFCGDVRFRCLIPPGLRERESAAEVRAVVERWFRDADVFEMESSSVGAVGDRVQARYRIRLREDGSWKICEQQIFADVIDGRIAAVDLLCSGFRPTT